MSLKITKKHASMVIIIPDIRHKNDDIQFHNLISHFFFNNYYLKHKTNIIVMTKYGFTSKYNFLKDT